MGKVHGQKKGRKSPALYNRMIVSFEILNTEGYEEELKKVAQERNYTADIYGNIENSIHQIARRILVDFLNDRKNGTNNRSKETSLSV